jgi:hypothetical protein
MPSVATSSFQLTCRRSAFKVTQTQITERKEGKPLGTKTGHFMRTVLGRSTEPNDSLTEESRRLSCDKTRRESVPTDMLSH